MPAITFRPLRSGDLPMLHEWLGRPHVAEWWAPTPTLDELRAEYEPVLGGDGPHRAAIALLDGEPFGFMQAYVPALLHDEGWWLDEHDLGVRGIDQFLADESRLGQGLGTAMVDAWTSLLLAEPGVWRVQVDPAPTNARAIRSYEKAGFIPVKVVDTPDGPALLMYRDANTTSAPRSRG